MAEQLNSEKSKDEVFEEVQLTSNVPKGYKCLFIFTVNQ